MICGRKQWFLAGFIVLLLLSMGLLSGCNEEDTKDQEGDAITVFR